jgi:hypothetical protein
MKMHRRAFLALALLIAGASTAAAAADQVTGIWSAHARTRGGLGAQWVFTTNGAAVATFGALVDFNYTIEGNRIIMTSAEHPESRKDPLIEEFSIDGDTMMVGTADKGKTMRRNGVPHAGAPIVGEWTFRHPGGQNALVRYSGEGVMQLSVPFQTATGTYRLDGDLLEVDVPGKPRAIFEVKRDGRTLTLTERSTGKAIQYTKLEY